MALRRVCIVATPDQLRELTFRFGILGCELLFDPSTSHVKLGA
jgi:hypothetical protein